MIMLIKKRKDGLFTRLPQFLIKDIREAKLRGYSLREIAEAYQVAKSTASLYCRDLYDDPQRIYQTEEEAREIIALRGLGKDHNVYHLCIDCGKTIRNTPIRCLHCNLTYQKLNGELAAFVKRGEPYRFREKDIIKFKVPTFINYYTRKHNYSLVWNAHVSTKYGAYRLSKILGIPKSTISTILTKIKRNKSLLN